MRNTIFGVFMAVVLASSARAGPLPGNGLDSDDAAWFYNRVGATLVELDADLAACRSFGLAMSAPNPDAAFSGLATDVFNAALQTGPRAAYADDCMIARNWRRYAIQDPNLAAFNARFTAMSAEQRGALIGGDTPPEGQLVRAWANDYWIARDGEPVTATLRPAVRASAFPGLITVQGIRPSNSIASIILRPQEVLIVVTASAQGARDAIVGFRRVEPLPTGPDGRPRFVQFDVRVRSGARVQQVFVVPAGTYALAAGGWANALNSAFTDFCLGTAAFVAREGQVLYLGDITISMTERVAIATSPAAQFGLRLDSGDIGPAQTVLAGSADFSARLEPAQFVNGVTHSCQPFIGRIYGFDIPGAPASNSLD